MIFEWLVGQALPVFGQQLVRVQGLVPFVQVAYCAIDSASGIGYTGVGNGRFHIFAALYIVIACCFIGVTEVREVET